MNSTTHSVLHRWRHVLFDVLPFLVGAVLGVVLPATIRAATGDAALRKYDLPADTAERALKRFSQQSELGVIVGSDAVADVRTNPVRGEMLAQEALTLMLAGTGLVAKQDSRNGAFAVRREFNDPNG